MSLCLLRLRIISSSSQNLEWRILTWSILWIILYTLNFTGIISNWSINFHILLWILLLTHTWQILILGWIIVYFRKFDFITDHWLWNNHTIIWKEVICQGMNWFVKIRSLLWYLFEMSKLVELIGVLIYVVKCITLETWTCVSWSHLIV